MQKWPKGFSGKRSSNKLQQCVRVCVHQMIPELNWFQLTVIHDDIDVSIQGENNSNKHLVIILKKKNPKFKNTDIQCTKLSFSGKFGQEIMRSIRFIV